jgi:hypothetical protein
MQGVKGEIIKPRRAWVGLVPAQTKKQIEEKKKKRKRRSPDGLAIVGPANWDLDRPIYLIIILYYYLKKVQIFFLKKSFKFFFVFFSCTFLSILLNIDLYFYTVKLKFWY